MKTMTCKQLGGVCEKKFTANSFAEIAELSKTHGMEMFQVQDLAHMQAMQKVMELMQDPTKMQAWFDEKKAEFDALAED